MNDPSIIHELDVEMDDLDNSHKKWVTSKFFNFQIFI